MSLKDRLQQWKARKAADPTFVPTVKLDVAPRFTFTAPLARSTDPETSHTAVALLTTRQSHAERLLEAFRANPGGLTAEEAADVAGIDPWAASKRVSDLRRAWEIQAKHEPPGKPVTRIGRSGRPATVYIPFVQVPF